QRDAHADLAPPSRDGVRHDAVEAENGECESDAAEQRREQGEDAFALERARELRDRKSTRLNSSHVKISYAVFCLKKKKKHTVSGRYSTKTRPWRPENFLGHPADTGNKGKLSRHHMSQRTHEFQHRVPRSLPELAR